MLARKGEQWASSWEMEEEGGFGGVVGVVVADGDGPVWVLPMDAACARRSLDAEALGADGDAAIGADEDGGAQAPDVGPPRAVRSGAQDSEVMRRRTFMRGPSARCHRRIRRWAAPRRAHARTSSFSIHCCVTARSRPRKCQPPRATGRVAVRFSDSGCHRIRPSSFRFSLKRPTPCASRRDGEVARSL